MSKSAGRKKKLSSESACFVSRNLKRSVGKRRKEKLRSW